MTTTDGLGTVLVTGGASGLGAAVAAAVEAEGGTPVVLDRNPPANGFAWQEVDLADGRAAHHRLRGAASPRSTAASTPS